MAQNTQGIFIFGVTAIASIVYSAYQFIVYIINRKLISYTTGLIVDTKTVVPEPMKKNNSRLAIVKFRVDSKYYISSNRVQVPMSAQIGDEIKIAYFKDNPSKLFTTSLKGASIFFIIGIICIAIMFYLICSN